MKNLILFLAILFGVTFTEGCYYDNEEELYPGMECKTDNVTYSGVVVNIIKDNCYQCHDAATNTANVTLEGYANLKKYTDNGKLLGVIQHKPGFSQMPKNQPKMIECNIAKIEAWIIAGGPNN